MMMVQINTEHTKTFANRCATASAELLELLGDLNKLYFQMALDIAPSPSVDFSSANREADDLGDLGYIADTLVLDAIGADEVAIPDSYQDNVSGPLHPIDTAIDTAGNLEDGGDEGQEIRDQRNAHVTVLALEAALRAGATVEVTDTGLIVAERKNGLPIDFGEIGEYVGIDDVEIPISARGGTTFGNVFITTPNKDANLDEHDRPIDQSTADLLEHEEVHSYQWAAAGVANYAALYMWESRHDPELMVERKTIDLPGPFDFDIPWIGLDMAPADVGCDNRFEQDADLEKGGYTCDD